MIYLFGYVYEHNLDVSEYKLIQPQMNLNKYFILV